MKEIEIFFVVHATEKSIYVELNGGIMFCPATYLISWSNLGFTFSLAGGPPDQKCNWFLCIRSALFNELQQAISTVFDADQAHYLMNINISWAKSSTQSKLIIKGFETLYNERTTKNDMALNLFLALPGQFCHNNFVWF